MKADIFWYPIEVAEVEIADSRGRQVGQGPDEKKNVKNSEIGNFLATKMLYTSKKSWEQSSFKLETKSKNFVLKNWKKKLITQFSIAKNQNVLSDLAKFLENLSR